ncbi:MULTISPECIES: hypothetical protein [unclassified Chelatococcus]|uniref:hypothetical protein n=1 Tax=unclassified Chelatococcus TaxID=2638111 RepID=UPI001BD05124|nr:MULTISPECIES: hypothetical protein [unclassified Chelatococcus]MBS7738351.1 hypothetical protein [Chelatococcus sp. HY11]MBX3545879.1 hypothetical protein [Chelatococcus sp.]MCO5077303.1 hypothetical protein [Chelatococcus sp.]
MSRKGRASRPASLALDTLGFALMMAAFFGWYIVLCPPASAAAANVGDAGALAVAASILATLFGIAVTLCGSLFLAIAATRAFYRSRTTYDEHGLPRRQDLHREPRREHHP